MDTKRLIAELPALTRDVEELDQELGKRFPELEASERKTLVLLLLIADLRANR